MLHTFYFLLQELPRSICQKKVGFGVFTFPDKETDTKMGCIEFIIICVGVGLCGSVGVGVGQCEHTITVALLKINKYIPLSRTFEGCLTPCKSNISSIRSKEIGFSEGILLLQDMSSNWTG